MSNDDKNRSTARVRNCVPAWSTAVVAVLAVATGCATDPSPTPMEVEEPPAEQQMEETPASTDEESAPAEPPAPAAPDSEADLQPINPEQSSAPPVKEGEIDAFVDTYREVRRVREAYEQRLTRAPNPTEAQAVQEEAFQAIRSTIENGQLEPRRFTEIADLAERDLRLATEIRERIEQADSQGS